MKRKLQFKICSIILFACIPDIYSFAQQTSLEKKASPKQINQIRTLKDALNELELKYNVFIAYKSELIENKDVYDKLKSQGSLEKDLTALLKGYDLKFKKVLDSFYVIEKETSVSQKKNDLKIEKEVQTVSNKSIIIKGQVVSKSDGHTLPSVSILVKGTSISTITDLDGRFSLTVDDPNSILVFSFIGYKSEEVALSGRTNIDVGLSMDIHNLDAVVVVGYGTQTVRELTGAVSQVKAEALEKIASSNFTSALQGQVAGVNVMSSSGAPGATANVQIRGVGSLSADAVNPLYVVDGIPFDQTPNFSTDEIESIEVLKDAASASIYGTRASNGVILITTKKGRAGEMKVSLDSYYGLTKILRNIPLINNTVDWLYVNRIRYLAVNPNDFGWTALDVHHHGLDYNTNWMEMFQVDNAPIQNHSLRLSGGTKDLTYSLVTGYFSQDGTWLNSAYERLSTRANTHFVKGRFNANVGLALSHDIRDISSSSLPSYAIRLRPFETPINYQDDAFALPESNPDAIANIARGLKQTNEEKGNDLSFSADLNFEVFDGFTLRTNVGGSQSNTYSKLFEPRFLFYNENGDQAPGGFPIARLQTGQNFQQHWISEFMGTYEKSFGDHKISVLAAYSMEQSVRESYNAGRRDFLSNDIQVLSGGAIDPTASGTKYVSSLVGSIGRLQYNYANRYLFSASVRRDGSSKFGDKHKYGTFPSFSAGWNIDEEPFYGNLGISSFLSSAKLRASYGTTGNQFISDYLYAAVVASGRDYVLGESDQKLALGVTQTDFSNVDVKWETSISKNIGLDLQFLNGSLTFTGDAYLTNKSDMLFPVSVPPSAGTGAAGSVIMNIGNMTNKGYELSSSYRKTGGAFNYSLTAVFTQNVNEVTQTNLESSVIYGGSGGTDPISVIREGYPAGSFFLIPTAGLITTQEDLAAYKQLVRGANLGDLKYIDVNKDGLVTDEDRVYMGSGSPKWEAGFTINANYRNFDFLTQLYGTYGNKNYNAIKSSAYANKRHLDVLNAWTPANPTSTVPTPNGSLSHNNYRSRTDYFLEDGSYLRVRNVQLGYNLPKAMISRISVSNFRVYISVENPLTFTRYTGNDPEIGRDGLLNKGIDNGNVPVTSQYRLGLQLGF